MDRDAAGCRPAKGECPRYFFVRGGGSRGAEGVQKGWNVRDWSTCCVRAFVCGGGSFNCTGGRTLSFSMYPRVTSTSFRISLACAQPLRRHLKGTDPKMQAVLGERERERERERETRGENLRALDDVDGRGEREVLVAAEEGVVAQAGREAGRSAESKHR